jgi:4-hydroxythreonine-4-phosphate dehydrogenase
MKRLFIALTVGDGNGIGPEVVLKSIARRSVRAICHPVLVGPEELFTSTAKRLHIRLRFVPYEPGRVPEPGCVALVEPTPRRTVRLQPGNITADAGAAAGAAIRTAGALARAGMVHAVVTAPVSKRAMHMAGIRSPGQTEMFQRMTGARDVAMMLVAPKLRVGLATIHIPLRAVARSLTKALVMSRLRIVHNALKRDWRINRPRIAVLGLNPHAGEGGDMGDEEKSIIEPAMRALRNQGIPADGPFPADAFFGRGNPGAYDAVFAMYHDQGLIPLKMSARGKGVNVSLGLPIVRTSPDHGTGFDIAGKGAADPASTIEAIRLAVAIARNRGIVLRRSDP